MGQQIRKGVQGATSTATLPSGAMPFAHPGLLTPKAAAGMGGAAGVNSPALATDSVLTVEAILRKMTESLRSLEDVHATHERHLIRIDADLAAAAAAVPQLEVEFNDASQRYAFFQETKCYIQDLLACLDEKVGRQFYR